MKFAGAVVSSVFLFCLNGCGGGSADSSNGNQASPTPMPTLTAPTIVLRGTAATGRAIEGGQVTAKCNGASGTTTTSPEGTFVMQIAGAFPCVLAVDDPLGGRKLHAVAFGNDDSAYVNLTPMTEIVMARATRMTPERVFAAFGQVSLSQLTANAIEEAQKELATALNGLVDTAAMGSFFTTPFKPATNASPQGGDAADNALEALSARFGKYGFEQLVLSAINARTTTEFSQGAAQAQLAAGPAVGGQLLPAGYRLTAFQSSLGGGFLYLALGIDAQDIKAVTASFNGTVTELKFTNGVLSNPMGSRYGGLPGWSATIPVSGDLPFGRHSLTITATDINGKTGSLTTDVSSNRPPSVEMATSAPSKIYWPNVRIAATCTDDDPRGCASITASINGKTVAQGTTSIDSVIDLTPYDRSAVSISVSAQDSTGLTASATGEVLYVESSLPVEKITEVSGQIWDVDATRILFYVQATNRLYIRDRVTGNDMLVFSQAYNREKTNGMWGGRLTSVGATYILNSPLLNPSASMYSFENGKTVALGPWGLLQTAGRYLVWQAYGAWSTLYRRDLVSDKTTVVSSTAGSFGGVNEDGSVTFTDHTYNIGINKVDGTTVWVTKDATGALQYTQPESDGINVLYKKEVAQTARLMLYKDGVEKEIFFSPWNNNMHGGVHYRISNGWVAYITQDARGVLQIWRMDPNGVTSQITSFAQVPSTVLGPMLQLDSLGRDGTLTFIAAYRRYLVAPSSSEQLDIGSGSTVFYVDGQPNLVVGVGLYALRK